MDLRSTSDSWPGFAHVFDISDPLANRPFRAGLDLLPGEGDIRFSRGEAKPDRPIRAGWRMGSPKPGDVIWTTLALPVLISERVVGILRDHRFSGWDVIPVELRGKGGELLPPYHYLSIHGRCGPIDYHRSKEIEKPWPSNPAKTSPVWIGLYFDPTTWDGSDFFMAPGRGHKFVVEGVKEALERAKVRNVMFEVLDEYETPFDPFKERRPADSGRE
jgi:hypothetical protein